LYGSIISIPHRLSFFIKAVTAFRALYLYRFAFCGLSDAYDSLAINAFVILVRFSVMPHIPPKTKFLRNLVLYIQIFVALNLSFIYVF